MSEKSVIAKIRDEIERIHGMIEGSHPAHAALGNLYDHVDDLVVKKEEATGEPEPDGADEAADEVQQKSAAPAQPQQPQPSAGSPAGKTSP